MLSDVLNYLKKGGEARVSTIARKLDMEEGTVEMLIDQLIKLGYLEVFEQDNELVDDNVDCSTLLNVKYKLIKKI
ncbi:MAG: FeoC-like transcriptional regulator [Candidatus Heimdallarchaeota archaeon]